LLYPADYLCYQAPAPSDSLRARLQRRLKRLAMARHFGTLPPLRHWHEKALAWLASWWLYPRPHSMTALPYQGEGRLLDCGCGAGWFAWQMRELGWDVTGMDFSEHATAHARRFGIPTLTGTLPHRDVAPSSYDVITMGAVLEHIHHPHRLIAAAAEALRPGGYLVVSVPNLDSWGFRHFGEDWGTPAAAPPVALHAGHAAATAHGARPGSSPATACSPPRLDASFAVGRAQAPR